MSMYYLYYPSTLRKYIIEQQGENEIENRVLMRYEENRLSL